MKTSKSTLREKVHSELKERIVSGDILPGQVITLKNLSDQFGVSIVPVREALFQLESEGVVIRRNNRDYRVNVLNSKQFQELYRIRFLNELYIARRAYRNKPKKARLTLGYILEDMQAAVDSPKLYIKMNHSFHFAMYSYAKSPLLFEFISSLWARIGPYFSITAEVAEKLETSFVFHQNMYNYFISGTEEQYISSLKEDLKYSYELLKPLIKKLESTILKD